MRIQFVNPPFLGRFSRSQRSPGIIKSGTMYYPYWLAHAAAFAEKNGHQIDLIDCPAAGLNEKQLFERVKQFKPGLVVLESVTASWYNDCKIAGQIKTFFPATRLCLTGTHVTALWQETLKAQPLVDFVAIGEYDYTITDLATQLEQGTSDLHTVKGIAYRYSGKIARTEDRALIQDLDELPWIAPIYKRFLDVKNYYFNLSHYPMVMLIGGRGCTSMCFYCVYPQVIHGHRYRHRSPEHIVGEMLWIQENMPEVREITFEDDNFVANRKFANRFAECVKQERVKLPFFANLRTTIDYDTLKSLKDAGLRNCAVGFESADNVILRNMRKGQNDKIQQKFIENAHKLGLLVHGCFMVGFPGETRETMKRTLKLAKRIAPDSAQFYPVMPYPGTGAYAYYQKNGYLATDNFREWLTRDGGHRCVLNLPGLTPEDIEKFCESAFRKFHFRPGYIFYKLVQALRHPGEGFRSVKAGLFYIWYLLGNKRTEEKAFDIKHIPMDENWNQFVKVPKGRMEQIQKGIQE